MGGRTGGAAVHTYEYQGGLAVRGVGSVRKITYSTERVGKHAIQVACYASMRLAIFALEHSARP